jgi:hypothetical protein
VNAVVSLATGGGKRASWMAFAGELNAFQASYERRNVEVRDADG